MNAMKTVRRTVLAVVVLSAGFASAAKQATPGEIIRKQIKDEKQQREALAALDVVNGFTVDRSQWSQYYLWRFGVDGRESPSDEELAKKTEANLAARKKLVELLPANVGFRMDYGKALMMFDRFAEAQTQFEEAAKLARDGQKGAAARFWLAEAKFGQGDRAGAKAALEELCALELKSLGRGDPGWQRKARQILAFLNGRPEDVLDVMKLPRDATAKAFPKPQEATYEETFVPLKEVAVKAEGLRPDDARLRLLKVKLGRLGVKVGEKGGYPLSIAVSADAPVKAREGYELETTKTGATIRAQDAQGALWGVVSFLQMVNPEKVELRLGKLRDWPDGEKRGYLGNFDLNMLEFALFNKMNSVVNQRHPPTHGNMFTPLLTYLSEEMARGFADFGLILYYSANWVTHAPQLPISNPRTLPFRIEVAKRYAKMKAGFYYPLDDIRFPLCKPDKEKFGTAANCDAKHINEIYQAVLAEYPDFRMIVCPPFYWGPDSKAPYEEDRETYLASYGQHLDKRVDVYWTGAQVKGFEKSVRQVKWMTDLIGRKPSIFQNGIGPHNLLDYAIDPIAWDRMHYAGFTKDISQFHNNSLSLGEIGPLATMAAWLWNEKGYVAAEAAKAGINQRYGAEAYDLLAPGLEALAYFDKYRYGKINENIVFEDAKDLEGKYNRAKEAYEKAIAYNPALSGAGSYGRGIGFAANVLKQAKSPRKDMFAKYKEDIAATRELALKETGAQLKTGEFIYTPCDLQNLLPKTGKYGPESTPRFVKWLRGAQSGSSTVSFRFECDPFPATGDYVLTIAGIQDELQEETLIRIAVNGQTVFEGPCGFPSMAGASEVRPDFKLRDFRIPFASMQRYNAVTVSCATPGFNPNAAPYIGVNYMVLRKSR